MKLQFRIRPSAAIVRDGAILLIEYDDPYIGRHYNFPGGGLEPGEAMEEGLKREVWEEACAEVEVGKIVYLYEHVARPAEWRVELNHSIIPIFACRLRDGCEPRMPVTPDTYQTGVRWVPLTKLLTTPLRPRASEALIEALTRMDETFVHYDFLRE